MWSLLKLLWDRRPSTGKGLLIRSVHNRILDCLPPRDPNFGRRVLQTSIPKSGSHLLMKVLQNLDENHRHPMTLYSYKPMAYYERNLRRLAIDRFAWGHLGYSPQVAKLVDDLDLDVVVMIRDPRDVILSFVDHVYRLKPHVLKSYYTSLPDEQARIQAAILGTSRENYAYRPRVADDGIYDMHVGFTSDIGVVLRNYRAWKNCPRAHIVRFESLVGPQGGGTEEEQSATVEGIIRFLRLSASPDKIIQICEKVFDRSSPTFNLGKSRRWEDAISTESMELLRSVAEREMAELGYCF